LAYAYARPVAICKTKSCDSLARIEAAAAKLADAFCRAVCVGVRTAEKTRTSFYFKSNMHLTPPFSCASVGLSHCTGNCGLQAACGAPEHKKDYSLKAYDALVAQLQRKARQLSGGWSCRSVELALYGAALAPSAKVPSPASTTAAAASLPTFAAAQAGASAEKAGTTDTDPHPAKRRRTRAHISKTAV
jgi:hypothetical protein